LISGHAAAYRLGQGAAIALTLVLTLGAIPTQAQVSQPAIAVTEASQSSTISPKWSVTVSASGAVSIDRIFAVGTGFAVVGSVDGALAGKTSAGWRDAYIARFSSAGTLEWSAQFGTTEGENVTAVAHGNGFFVGGFTTGSFTGDPARPDFDGFVASVSEAGALNWVRQFGGVGDQRVSGVAAAPDGSVIVVGESLNAAVVRRYTASGGLAWERTIQAVSPTGNQKWAGARDVVADAGGFTVMGATDGSIDPAVTRSLRDLWLRRYSYAGTVVWTRQLDSERPHPDTGAPMEVRADGESIAASDSGIFLTGASHWPLIGPGEGNNSDWYEFVRKYAFDGEARWTKSYNAVRGVGDCSGLLTVGSVTDESSQGYRGGQLARLSATGDEDWQYTQLGNPTVGEWDYVDVARGAAYLYVVRHHTQYNPTRETHDVVALSGVSPATGCEPLPSVTAPIHRLTVGSISSTGKIPHLLEWSAAGGSGGIARYELRQSTNGGAWVKVATGITGPSTIRSIKAKRSYRFSVRAIDGAGRASAWANGPTFRVRLKQDDAAAIGYRGGWNRAASTAYLGGSVRWSTNIAATATYTFTGTSVAWVAALGPKRGSVKVYVNQALIQTVNLNAGANQARRVVFAMRWPTSVTRQIRLEIVGSVGHPRGDLDAFVVTQ
jgi:hypothetical protein